MAQRKNPFPTMQSLITYMSGPDACGGADADELQGALLQGLHTWAANGSTLDDARTLRQALWFTEIMQGYVPGTPAGVPRVQLKEGARRDLIMQSISTADFPDIFGTLIHRRLLGMFQASPPAARRLCQTTVRTDFRMNKDFFISGGKDELQLVEKRGIPRESDKMADSTFEYKMEVYAKNQSINWRDLVDDAGDLRIFDRLSQLMFFSARKTEELFILRNFFVNAAKTGWNADSGGPFVAGAPSYGAAVQTNALSMAAIVANAAIMRQLDDPDGSPMQVRPSILVVNRALDIEARNILAAKQVRKDSGSAGLYSTDSPVLQLGLDVLVLDWLDYAADGAGTKATGMWGLFANPTDPMVPTAVAEFATFKGFETPQIYQKDNNRRAVGGAPTQVMGDFENMDETFQIVYPMGGTTMFGTTAIVSNGS